MSLVAPYSLAGDVDNARRDQHRPVWRSHLHILPAFLVALAVCVWFATWGDWKFFQPEALGAFYDAQALSILNGRLDVPKEAIGFEAFIAGGKYYGYFGVAPTLLRIPLLLLFGDLDGQWSRAMMMLASTLGLFCAYRILIGARGDGPRTPAQKVMESIFVVAAVMGSTNIFIGARSFVFHEAIIWGSTFALLFTCALVKYLRSPNSRSLILAGLFAFMSFNSRATAGAGALAALGLLATILICRVVTQKEIAREQFALPDVRRAERHALIAIAALVLTLTTHFGINYAKFGTFNVLPLQYYNLYRQDPGRMQLTGAHQIHLGNLPTGLATYFGWRGASFDRHFPWIYLAHRPTRVGDPTIDVVEGFSTFPASMPALTLLAIVGIVRLLRSREDAIRRLRLPFGALLLGGGISLMTVGITERYLHDLYPALIIAAAVGVSAIGLGKNLRLKVALLVLLTIFSAACNCAFALVYQRVGPWGVPAAKSAEFYQVQQRIDSIF
jgi:hypothetical protein